MALRQRLWRDKIIEDVKAKVDANADQLIAIFKDIQGNRELGST